MKNNSMRSWEFLRAQQQGTPYIKCWYFPVLPNLSKGTDVIYSTVQALRIVPAIIQFLKVKYLFLTLQVHLTLPSVFCETDSVFLRADT